MRDRTTIDRDVLWARNPLPPSALLEGDPDPLLPAPDHVAGPLRAIASDPQGEAIRKPQRAVDLECRARGGEVADRPGNRVAAELDRARLEDAEALRPAVLWIICRFHGVT